MGSRPFRALRSCLPADGDDDGHAGQRQSAFIEGFSLHAGTHVTADDRLGLERLARYAGRPSLALSRLTLTPARMIAYRLKRPRRRGAAAIQR